MYVVSEEVGARVKEGCEGTCSGIQKPTVVCGLVWRNVESWCGTTSPPIPGCLKMYMLCATNGSCSCRLRATAIMAGWNVKARNLQQKQKNC